VVKTELPQRLCRFYVERVALVGALYCVVPTLVWFTWMFASLPFRGVYVLRLALSILLGTPVAAAANRFALSLWLLKHRSPSGPGTALDGLLIGGAAGYGSALLPPLTALIATNHPEQAKTFILAAWLAASAIGALWGAALASFGRRHLPAVAEDWERP